MIAQNNFFSIYPWFYPRGGGGLLVAMGSQQEVEGLARFVEGTVQVPPLPLNLDIRLIHPPAVAHRTLLPVPESRFPVGGELLESAVKVRMVDRDATLFHPVLQIPIAQQVSQVLMDTGEDDIFFKAVAFAVDHDCLSEEKIYACSISQPAPIKLTQQNSGE